MLDVLKALYEVKCERFFFFPRFKVAVVVGNQKSAFFCVISFVHFCASSVR